MTELAPVSACVIARDEALNLPACISALRGKVAEIVVIDTGSTDTTPSVAADLGARVATFEWIDDFAAARNFAASRARQPFILMVDADERLAEDSLVPLLEYCGTRHMAGRVIRENLLDDGAPGSVREHLTRLYPNQPGFSWVGRVHEQLTLNLAPPIPVQTGVVLRHSGYQTAELERGDKIARNLRLLDLERQARPTDAYVLYQLGRTHYAAGDWSAARACLATATELLASVPLHTVGYLPSLLRIYAQASLRAGAVQTAFNILDAATDLFPDYTDLYFTYGLAILESGDPKRLHEIRDVFEGCLAIGEADPARYETVSGVGSFLARHNLGAFYEAAGNLPQARAEYHEAADAGYGPSAGRLAALTSSA